MNRILLLVLFVLTCVCYGRAQMPVVLSDKIALQESQFFKNKSAFKENQSSAETDFIYQRMEWKIDPEIRYISGKITTYFKSKIPDLTEVYFDLSETLQLDSVIQNNQNIEFSHENELITIPLLTNLSENQIDSVCIYYKGIPPDTGFGSFSISTHGEDQTPILWTLSEPYGAKEWWPCKQSLSDKIDSIDVIVRSPEMYRTASNGILISEVATHGERIMHWKHRFPIATYLVAIAVTNYASYSDYLDLSDDRKIEILNYVYPENLAKAKTQTPITVELIELYNALVGEYPFASEKYGHAQFGWGGGMEHQTMSFMGNFSFGLIAHELAHQWFGDYITLGSWQHIWLNEGFATYLTGLAHENLADPQWWPIWKKENKNKVLSQPYGSVFVQDTTSISKLFSSRLSYAKGGFLLHMQRWILGDEIFFTALKNYFADEKIANGFAFTQDWIQHIETAGDTALTEFFNDWFYGEGYPIYSINYQQSNAELLTLELTQTTTHESVDFFEMPVPIRVYGNNKTDSANFRLNHTTNHQHFVLNPGFIVEEIVIDPDDWMLCKSDQIVSTTAVYKQNEISMYPNPATNKVTVFVTGGEIVVQIRIYSVDGKREKETFGYTNEIDLSKLQAGVYLVQIETLNSVYKQKIIKQ